jgi:hypothetical protein
LKIRGENKMPMGPTILNLNNTFTVCKKCGYKMFHIFLIGSPRMAISINAEGFLENWEGDCLKCKYPWIADCRENKKTIKIADSEELEKEELTLENPFIVQLREINKNLKSISASLKSIENRLKDPFNVYSKKG